MGTNLWHSERLIEMTRKYVQEVLVQDAFYSESNIKQQIIDFIGHYENAFQEKLEFIEAVAFDTAMMLFQIMSHAEIKSRTDLKNHLLKIRNHNRMTSLTYFKTN